MRNWDVNAFFLRGAGPSRSALFLRGASPSRSALFLRGASPSRSALFLRGASPSQEKSGARGACLSPPREEPPAGPSTRRTAHPSDSRDPTPGTTDYPSRPTPRPGIKHADAPSSPRGARGAGPSQEKSGARGACLSPPREEPPAAPAPGALPTPVTHETPSQEPLITPRGRRRAPASNTPMPPVRLGEREGPAPRKKRAEREGPAPRKRRAECESADKPGSVEGNHSSRAPVAGCLQRPTRAQRGPRLRAPIWPCSGRGLPSRRRCRRTRCALTAPFHPCRRHRESAGGGLLSVALSVGSRPPGVTWHPVLWSPDFPLRRMTQRLPGRLAWPPYHVGRVARR